MVIQRTINSDKGHITGFEAQVSTFFDFDGVPAFLKNFGVQANVTRLNGQALYANFGDKNDLINRPLQGLSKWSYNLIGMYEHAGLSLRAAYNWRSTPIA